MIATNNIDKKITSLLPELSLQQKKTVLTVIKTFTQEHTEAWQNNDYDVEMDRRFAEYESGNVKTYTIEETIAAAKKAYRAKQI